MKRAILLGFFSLTAFSQAPYDTILTGGRIVDGTGNAWFYGDLAIRGGRIARIAPPGVSCATCDRERASSM